MRAQKSASATWRARTWRVWLRGLSATEHNHIPSSADISRFFVLFLPRAGA